MAHVSEARHDVDAIIPVFCTSQIPITTINKFFKEANAATSECSYDEPQGVLVTTDDLLKLDFSPTAPPIDKGALQSNPFRGQSASEVAMWAKVYLYRRELSPKNLVILDERSPDDEICLLVSPKDFLDGSDTYYVRADFESSIITLMTIEIGYGGDEHLDVDYKGSDGVLRISVRDR